MSTSAASSGASSKPSPAAHDALAAARSLRRDVDRNAHAAGDAPVSRETLEAFAAHDLFGLMAPRAVGGRELPLLDALAVIEEVSRGDGSAGWCLMASATTIAFFGAYGGDDFVSEVFANGVPRAAGQFAPNGKAVRERGGYRVSGSYQFGSGIDYADWVGAGVLAETEGGPEAPPEFRFALLPRADVAVGGNWDVMGLRSTASFDYTVDDVWIPEEATFLFAAPTRRRGGPVFELGVMVLTAVGHLGFALGVARRALDEMAVASRTKVRMAAPHLLADDERFLESLGRLESRWQASRAWAREVLARAEDTARRTSAADPAESLLVRQATVHVTEEAAEIVRGAYLALGTTALRAGPLERCFRDIHAASQHFFASPASTLEMGRSLVAAAPDDPLEA